MSDKPLPAAAVVTLDILLLAGSLLTFAYFHHVRSNTLTTDQALLDYIASLETAPAETTIMPPETTAAVSETTAAASAKATTVSTKKTDRTTQTETATETETAKPEYDDSGFGAKWPAHFLPAGETDTDGLTYYKSHDVNIRISEYNAYDSRVCVADIFLRSTANFTYAFAQDGDPSVYANGLVTGLLESMYDISERTDAILAVNGDFIGQRQYGYVIRNGYPWRTEPWDEVCALFQDGSVEIYDRDAFDVYAAFKKGLRHTFAFGPPLVRDCNTLTGDTAVHMVVKNPRTGFGYYEPGHYCFVTVDGRDMGGSAGMTSDEFAMFCGKTLGCTHAFNLDGGASSQMMFMGQMVNLPDGFDGTPGSIRGMSDVYIIKEVQP